MGIPSPNKKNLPPVVISGDVTTDYNIAQLDEKAGNERESLKIYRHRGSALMLADMMKRLLKDQAGKVYCPLDPQTEIDPESSRFYVKWKRIEAEKKSAEKKSKEKVWRAAEILGLQQSRKRPPAYVSGRDNPNAGIVIIDDGNLGFRNPESKEFWPAALNNKDQPPWVLVKMCSPIAQGGLWSELHKAHTKKLVALLTIDDLRRSDVRISRELSWELTAQDLVRELIYNPAVNSLSHCAFVIVTLGMEGAVILSQPESDTPGCEHYTKPNSHLIFDPTMIEGEWHHKYPGLMVGYKTCMTASIALSLMEYDLSLREYDQRKKAKKPDEPEEAPPDKNLAIRDGVKRGLGAMRELHSKGYEEKVNKKGTLTELAFPFDPIVNSIDTFTPEASRFADCEIRPPAPPSSPRENDSEEFWTILAEYYSEWLDGLAVRIAINGVEAELKDVPRLEFKKLLTVDRREIESYRCIRTLITEYADAKTDKPLSIAVFGAPGSGKSFGITQMAESLLAGKIETLTFNLSQFASEAELWPAMHRVRDVSLDGKLPVVFWDEFDTALENKPLGWLRYFLAPMQDGKFQHGQITHPIGKSIFVFAGGTAETLSMFENSGGEAGPIPADSEENASPESRRPEKGPAEKSEDAALKTAELRDKQKEVKLPDFLSRLKGFINILGPNPVKADASGTDAEDNFYVIRRAILLRSLLLRDAPQFFSGITDEEKKSGKLEISNGVLHAFLETSKYKHGSRSMDYLIAMSTKTGKQKFDRSSLPSKAQLDLHVDAENFMSLVNEVWFSGETLEKLATEVHKAYQRLFRGKGKDYEKLTEHFKDQNRDFVHDIIPKLRICNCSVVPKHESFKQFEFFPYEIEFLSRLEHNRWLKKKIKNNFRYASEETKAEAQKENPRVKLNDAMLFWDKADESEFKSILDKKKNAVGSDILSAKIKENNRKMIRRIPKILSAGGYAVVRNQDYTLKIGVTGHRFLADIEKLNNGIDKALLEIEECFPDQQIALLSALAEGADRLAAHRVLARPGAKLIAALPLSAGNYETDFETEESKEEFRLLLDRAGEVIETQKSVIRDEAYREVGKYVLDNCDVLLAVWDGKDAQGPGGTGEIVKMARERNFPVAWVRAGNRKRGTNKITTLGKRQGIVTFEKFPKKPES